MSASSIRPKIHRRPVFSSAAAVHRPAGARILLGASVVGVSLAFIWFPTVNFYPLPGAEIPPLASVLAAPVAAYMPEISPKTIVLTDNENGIIGQMAKIPAKNEAISELSSASEVDNRPARDLLTIISKY